MNYKKYFKKASPVYSDLYSNDKNISLIFYIDFKKDDDLYLSITGANEYQVFLNGKLVRFGPAKAAIRYHRVDKFKLINLKENNRLYFILSGYNINSYDRVNEQPFICYELTKNDQVIDYSNINSNCFLNESRYQKVTRFSYQRNFSESYNNLIENHKFNFDEKILFKKINVVNVDAGEMLDKITPDPDLIYKDYELKNKGSISIDKDKKVYEDRYMILDFLGLFPKNTWEINPNDIVSKFVHNQYEKINNIIKSNEFITYKNDVSLTGFISLDIDVEDDAEIYLYFDELNNNNSEDDIEFNFYRNTTHNIVTYELKKGHYELTSFIPYTFKYIKCATLKGEARVNKLGIIRLENGNSDNFKYNVKNPQITAIFDAAINTFKQNSVDILTDCPSRERAGWLCDGFFSGRAETIISGDNKVEKALLDNYANYKSNGDLPDGMIPMCYPADFPDKTYIPNWAMFYVIELYEYYKKTNDDELLNKSKHILTGLLDFFKKYENEYGLLENLQSWVMIEWSHANDPESIKGVNYPSNMLYAQTLNYCGLLLNDNFLIEKANNLKKTIKEFAFNGEFFVDNSIRDTNNKLLRTNRICETTQYYAFYFETATNDEYPELLNMLLNEFGPNRDDTKTHQNVFKSAVFIGDYLRLEMLNKYGYKQKVLEETVDYFYGMAEKTGTLWEHDNTYASLNHCFTSFIINIILNSLCGLQEINNFKKEIIFDDLKAGNFDFEFIIPLTDGVLNIKNLNGDLSINKPESYKIINK